MSKPTLLILGACSEIATPLARLYAQNGYSIILAARRAERLETLAMDLRIRYSQKVEIQEFDVLETAGHKAFLERIGILPDTVITLIGLMTPNDEALSDFKTADLMIRSNYLGLVSIVGEIANRMEQRGSGTIIGVSSVAGDRGRAANYIYGSAKAGYSAFLSGLRNRLFARGIAVITVKPGFIRTRMTEKMALPAPLAADPEEVARAIRRAHQRKSMVVYYRPVWRLIMLIVRSLPERIFVRTRI
jgi:short-subunit dehydrogenase